MTELTMKDAGKLIAAQGDESSSNGWVALLAYAKRMYGRVEPEPVAQCMQDLLGDLMHLTDALELEPGSDLSFDDAEDVVFELSEDINDEDEANEARAGNGWVGFSAYVEKNHSDTRGLNASASLLSLVVSLKQFATFTGLDFEQINAGAIATHKSEQQAP